MKNKKYVWTQAWCDGWGCIGVWPKDLVDAAETDKDDGRPILNESDMIVGQGGGWDSGGTFNDKWMRLACEAINNYQSAPKTPKTPKTRQKRNF